MKRPNRTDKRYKSPAVHVEVAHSMEARVFLGEAQKKFAAAAQSLRTEVGILSWLVSFCQLSREQIVADLKNGDLELLTPLSIITGKQRFDRSRVADAAEILEGGFRSVSKGNRWEQTLPSVTFVVESESKSGARWRAGLESYVSEDPLVAIILRAKEAAQAEGGRLRECGAKYADRICGKIFVKRRAAKFCSKRCAQRERISRWRNLNPEKVRLRRRKYYENRVKRLYGKNVQVGKRTVAGIRTRKR